MLVIFNEVLLIDGKYTNYDSTKMTSNDIATMSFRNGEYKNITQDDTQGIINIAVCVDRVHLGRNEQKEFCLQGFLNTILINGKFKKDKVQIGDSKKMDIYKIIEKGVDSIKKALTGPGAIHEDTTLKIATNGSPSYRISVKAPNYKQAEEELKTAVDMVLKVFKSEGGNGSFVRV